MRTKSINPENRWRTMSPPDNSSQRLINGQMHVLARFRHQTFAQNRAYKAHGSSVIEHFRGRLRQQTKIDRNGMPLHRPDTQSIFRNRETFLVTGLNNAQQIVSTEALPRQTGFLNHVIDDGPALHIQSETDCFGAMAKNKAQEFTKLN